MKARYFPVQFTAANKKKAKFMAAKKKEKQWRYKVTKQNDKKMALYVLFEKKNTVLFLYFICLLFNLQIFQIILPDPVLARKSGCQR